MNDNVILLVEDNPDDALLTREAIESKGIANKVVHVRDGVEALDYLFCRGEYADRNIKELPALTLLDINMPRLGGLDVLKAVRENEHTANIPIVVLTTSTEESDLVKSYNLGTNSFVKKPVDFNEFSEAINMLGIYWLLLNKIPGRE